MKYFSVLIVILCCSFINFSFSEKEVFTPEVLQKMKKISNTILSVDGKYLLFSESLWDEETGKSTTVLKYKNIQTEEIKDILNESVSNLVFSTYSPNFLYFLKSGQIYIISFPPKQGEEPEQLTKYEIKVNNFKIGYDSIVFTADVYFDCKNFNCSAQKIEEEAKNEYEVYDRLFMFHWDKWLPQGKGGHIFMQKIKKNTSEKIELTGEPVDLTEGMEINVPFYETGKENYDVSSDGKMATFTGLLRTHDESWNTAWKTYFIIFDSMKQPFLITTKNDGRTEQPSFSLDNTKIAFLSMKTPMLEAEDEHLEVYNILTNKIDIVNDKGFDLSIGSYIWINDHTIYFLAENRGLNCIFKLNFADSINPEYTLLTKSSPIISYGLPFTALKNRKILLANKVGYNYPSRIVMFNDVNEKVILNGNPGFEDKYFFSLPESFSYIGAHNDTIQGWILTPNNLDKTKKYPVSLLIHGGPTQSWNSGFSTNTWNPQIWTNEGYVTILLNIHGSTGVTNKFKDDVRTDWGGAPYQDIALGLKYVFDTYTYTDRENTCALGGSYGGYMVTWLQGHPEMLENFKFKCLISHDGAFSIMSKFYATDEQWFQKSSFCPRDNINCNPWEKEAREIIEANSPERYVNKWSIPMLLVQGGRDYRVPTTEALSAFTALQLKGVDSKLLFYPKENHWVLRTENIIQWHKQVLGWQAKYTKH